MLRIILAATLGLATPAIADTRTVYLEDAAGTRTQIATLDIDDTGKYAVSMEGAFGDFFLSMRPFKCLEGPGKNWCHVPYPYPLARDLSDNPTDLSYDFLFVWKNTNDYGINMWNGVYYDIAEVDGTYVGTLHEMDMDLLSSPPPADLTHPLRAQDIHASDPDSHWLPTLIIE